MKIKKILAGVLACITVFGALPYSNYVISENNAITANAEIYENFTYTKYSDHIEISDCREASTEAVIPSEIDGLPVTSIGDNAFKDCVSLKSITIPDSVTSMGEGIIFESCSSLISITVGENNSNYTDVDGVLFNKDLSEIIFYPPKKGTSYTIPDGVVSIGNFAFAYCLDLTSVTIPESVTSIGEKAFYRCESLTSITIPEGVTSIGKQAFRDCCFNPISITIPDSVTEIGDKAFYGCGLTSITVGENNSNYADVDGVLFNKDLSEIILYPSNKKGTSYAIPDGVASIGENAFNGSSLTSITIPESVTSIGNSAFEFCLDLISITIPDSVTSIGNSAFANCSGLTSIMISDGVTSIGASAFYRCESLTSIKIPDSVTSIEDDAFYYCSNLTSITVGENNSSYTDVDGILFNKDLSKIISYPPKKETSYYTIPESVTSLGSMAFSGCSNLTSITIPESVTSIGIWAFGDCKGLTSITIPESVTSIGNYAFVNCIGLKSITIPESVMSIGLYAFGNCKNMTSIAIENPECEIYDDKNTILFTTTIYGYKDSTAQAYAEKYHRKFVTLGDVTAAGFGDINGDGAINASDASEILDYYSKISSGAAGNPDISAFDINKDGTVDSSDASVILSYYSYKSSGGTDTLEEFIKTE